MSIVYLACPYSNPNADVRLARFNAATHVAAKLIERGLIVFSPITMTHPIDLILAAEGDTLGSEYWVEFDISFMQACSEIRILTLPGWRESQGVRREIAFFEEHGVAPQFLSPDEYGVTGKHGAFRAAFEPGR